MLKRNYKSSFFSFYKLLMIMLFACITNYVSAQQILRVVIAGLNHDHVHGILSQYNKGTVDIVGIAA